MHIKMIAGVLAAACISLVGCGSGGSSAAAIAPGTPDAGTTGIQVLSVSGTNYALDGTYGTGCSDRNFAADAQDSRDIVEIAGSSYVTYELNYLSTDGSCAGSPVENHREGSTIATVSAGAIDGWSDGIVLATPPPLANDGSTLGTSESFTLLSKVVVTSSWPGLPDNSGAGRTSDLYFIVDNTPGGAVVLYQTECSTSMGSLYAACMVKPDVGSRWVKQ